MTLKIVTQTLPGHYTTVEYHEAETKVDGAFLTITHRDPKSKKRMLSRVPLANIVQTLEDLPEKAS